MPDMSLATNANVDPSELQKFGALAHRWWDPQSEFRPLHDINPLRLQWIDQHVDLSGKRVIDVGCGGGLLSEGMASLGAKVTGIDLGEKALAVAKLHLYESGYAVDYRLTAVEAIAEESPEQFDVVTCMEMLEHVPDPASIVAACAKLVKPGGQVFFSTLNRTPKAWLLGVVGAEYLLNLLPRGTHDYTHFIKPAELAAFCRHAELSTAEIVGMHYNPLTRKCTLTTDTGINYLLRAQRHV
jgi:2-polyprenyl-6-hydroxyphenyl methylase/3-demethylubiquinone-9 3-methyltransferase